MNIFLGLDKSLLLSLSRSSKHVNTAKCINGRKKSLCRGSGNKMALQRVVNR